MVSSALSLPAGGPTGISESSVAKPPSGGAATWCTKKNLLKLAAGSLAAGLSFKSAQPLIGNQLSGQSTFPGNEATPNPLTNPDLPGGENLRSGRALGEAFGERDCRVRVKNEEECLNSTQPPNKCFSAKVDEKYFYSKSQARERFRKTGIVVGAGVAAMAASCLFVPFMPRDSSKDNIATMAFGALLTGGMILSLVACIPLIRVAIVLNKLDGDDGGYCVFPRPYTGPHS